MSAASMSVAIKAAIYLVRAPGKLVTFSSHTITWWFWEPGKVPGALQSWSHLFTFRSHQSGGCQTGKWRPKRHSSNSKISQLSYQTCALSCLYTKFWSGERKPAGRFVSDRGRFLWNWRKLLSVELHLGIRQTSFCLSSWGEPEWVTFRIPTQTCSYSSSQTTMTTRTWAKLHSQTLS